jgi:hypothetical protein
MKIKLFIAGLMSVIMGGCITSAPDYLPESDEIDVNPYGSYIMVTQKKGVDVEGELLAIDSSKIIILTQTDTTRPKKSAIVSLKNVSKFKLLYAKPANYDWSALLPLSAISHGWYLILTFPMNLIATISVFTGAKNAFTYNDEEITLKELKKFARFPQGIPPDIDIKSIK